MQGRERTRALAAEALGTLFLVACVVGSGIMAERLTQDAALRLLCSAIPTGAILFVLIVLFAPVSGAHFNPAVTLAMAMTKQITPRTALYYMPAQIAGGVTGTVLAHAMFALPILAAGAVVRSGWSQWLSEGVATFGLVLTILGNRRRSDLATAAAVGLYIAAAYWFTASTSFANPAVTIARAFTSGPAGIRLADAGPFAAAQYLGAIFATICITSIFYDLSASLATDAAENSSEACKKSNSQHRRFMRNL